MPRWARPRGAVRGSPQGDGSCRHRPIDVETLAKSRDTCEFDVPPFDSKDREVPLSVPGATRADGGARLAEVHQQRAEADVHVLPLIAAVPLLFYWWPRRLYTEHLVLFLHDHAFTFLLIGAMEVVNAVSELKVPYVGVIGFLNFLLFLYLPWYVFRSMRVVYGQGRWLTLVKFFFLTAIYFTLLGITMFAGLVYSMMQL